MTFGREVTKNTVIYGAYQGTSGGLKNLRFSLAQIIFLCGIPSAVFSHNEEMCG
jgi:hypothetical protein